MSSQTAISVQGYLQLTSKQREELMQMRLVCLASLSNIIDERNSIHAFITVSAQIGL